MDFGALPPEINSGLMYSGPGSEPMLAASAAWDELASRAGHGGGLLLVADQRVDKRALAGAGIDVDGDRCRTLRGVDDHHRHPG